MDFFGKDCTIQAAKTTMTRLFSSCKNASVMQTPALDAIILLCHFLQYSKTDLVCNAQNIISAKILHKLESATKKRLKGLPIAYITGTKEFFGYDFIVSKDVLIPKPDTETLVEKAFDFAKTAACGTAKSGLATKTLARERDVASNACADATTMSDDTCDIATTSNFAIADICTGSGCVGISLLNELCKIGFTNMTCDFTDLSKKALRIAKKNANTLLEPKILQQSAFFNGDLCKNLHAQKKYNLIVSNPPYVPKKLTDSLLLDGRCEPRLALDGDTDIFAKSCNTNDGLAIIRRLCIQVKEKLCKGGAFFVETGEYNAEATKNYLTSLGFTDIVIHKDLAGLLRVVEAHL